MDPRNSPGTGLDARTIVTTRVFDAPREFVFEAWTNPKHLVQWWGPQLTMKGLFPSAAERDRVAEKYGAVEGGKQTLERLAEHLATMG